MGDRVPLTFELWDAETGNASGVYASVHEVLGVVDGAVRRDGEATLRGLMLVEVLGGKRELLADAEALRSMLRARRGQAGRER